MWALIVNNQVVELTEVDPAGRYDPDMDWRKAPEDAEQGDHFEGGIYTKPPFDAASAVLEKRAEITGLFQLATAAISAQYTPEEIATFPIQQGEAKAWILDHDADTPALDFLVANRPGVGKATLATRIVENATAYSGIVFPAMSKKQAYEDALYKIDLETATAADFDAIEVDYNV